jgi:hypothetical protein
VEVRKILGGDGCDRDGDGGRQCADCLRFLRHEGLAISIIEGKANK